MDYEADKKAFDLPAWLQICLVVLPVIAYYFIYFDKYEVYSALRVSTQLINIRFEETLLFLLTLLVAVFTVLFLGFYEFVVRSDHKTSIQRFVIRLWFVFVLVQLISIISIMIGSGRFGPVPIIRSALCLVAPLALFLLTNRLFIFKRLEGYPVYVAGALIGWAAIFCAMTNAAFIQLHNSSYQVCNSDNALIVGYDSIGRAIEKQIIRIDSRGVCELELGYQLVDVSDKEIVLESFTAIEVLGDL